MAARPRAALPVAPAALLLLAPALALAGGGAEPEAEPLEDGVALAGALGGTGDFADFTLEVPAGADVLWLRLTAEPTASDLDLFARRGAPATRAAHDWRSNGASADEQVKVLAPQPGTYHVRVESHRGAAAFEVLGTYAALEPARTWHAGADTTYWWAYDDARRADILASTVAAGMNTIYVDGKDGSGKVAWTTPASPKAFAFADGESPLERVVRDVQGMEAPRPAVAVRFATFHDAHAARDLIPHAAIQGTDWLDPACDATRAHVAAQVLDLLARTAVDEVNLDFVRFPAGSQVSGSAALPCTGGTYASPAQSKTQAVAEAVAAIRTAVKARFPAVVLSGDVFGYACHAPVASVGHDAFLLARELDVVMPMLYPTSFGGSAGADPYGTVRAATEACVHQARSREQVKPWVQGFDSSGYDYDSVPQVAAQVQAVRDAGGSGAAVWWFVSMGTDPATWAQLAPSMPPGAEQRVRREAVRLWDGFETGAQQLRALDHGGAGRWASVGKRSAEGARAAHMGFAEGGYDVLERDALLLGPVDLRGLDAPVLVFRHWAEGDAGCATGSPGAPCLPVLGDGDRGAVQASADGGLFWTTVRDDVVATPGWRTEVVDLAAWAGEADVRLRFLWTSDADGSEAGQGDGWYVDAVQVADLGG